MPRPVVRTLTDIPLQPELRSRLLSVSLVKGAHATTAIEGNTLSEEEVARIQDGWSAPPSKEYLQITKSEVFKRKRALILHMPINKKLTAEDMIAVTPEIARRYATVGKATVARDIKELLEMGLIIKEGRMFVANTAVLKEMVPKKHEALR